MCVCVRVRGCSFLLKKLFPLPVPVRKNRQNKYGKVRVVYLKRKMKNPLCNRQLKEKVSAIRRKEVKGNVDDKENGTTARTLFVGKKWS